MEQFLLNLWKLSLLGGAVIALLLALRPLLGKRYHARMFCMLWLFLAVLLLLPFDYSVKSTPMRLERPKDYTVYVSSDKTTVVQTELFFSESLTVPAQRREDLAISEPTRYISVTAILFYTYVAGAIVFAGVQLVRYGRFRRILRRWKKDCTADDVTQLLSAEAKSIGIKPPRLAVCEVVPTPMLLGLLHPMLLLPHEQYTKTELRFILRHELFHLKHCDMAYKLVMLAANAMHWFNPLIYLMLRTADEDIELSCDSAATCGMENSEKLAYSEALLSAAQGRTYAVPATSCFGGTKLRLKRRIKNVFSKEKRRGIGAVIFIVIAVIAFGAVISWGEKEEHVSSAEPSAMDTSERLEKMATNEGDEQKNELVSSYPSTVDIAKSNEASDSAELSPDNHIPDKLEDVLDYAGYLWFVDDGYFSRYADGKGVEQIYELPLADDGKTPVPASVFVKAEKIALAYHVGGATMGHNEMRLFDGITGAQTHEVIDYGVVEFCGDIIVKTTGFVPPAPDNLRISRDCGKTWDTLGDAKYLYGMSVTVTGSTVSYQADDSLSLKGDYLYITGIDTSTWDSRNASTPETLSLRVDLATGETGTLL